MLLKIRWKDCLAADDTYQTVDTVPSEALKTFMDSKQFESESDYMGRQHARRQPKDRKQDTQKNESVPLSDYELKRQENVAKNQKALALLVTTSLGMASEAPEARPTKVSKRRRVEQEARNNGIIGIRRSTRKRKPLPGKK